MVEFSQMRDGRWTVYQAGDWLGTLGQLPSGTWVFIGRLGMGAFGIGRTMEAAVLDGLRGEEST